jgi:hypothetical protein
MSVNLDLTRTNQLNPDNLANQILVSEEPIIQQLNGENIRISTNDEKNEIMIQNLKSYIFQQNSNKSYVKLGTFLPEIIKKMKQQPEFTKLTDFFDDIKNNTLETNLTNYIKDKKTLETLESYINLVDNKINSIPIDSIVIKGGSKKRQRKTLIKKGGSPKIQDIINTNKKDLNYYTIIGVENEDIIKNKKFLIYFQFNFSNGTNNNRTLMDLNQRIDKLKNDSLNIIQSCFDEVYTNQSKKKEICEKYLQEINKLDEEFDNSIKIEGSMYLFLYNPDEEGKAEIVAGPYNAKLHYDFSEQNIKSFTSEKFKNFKLLNLYMCNELNTNEDPMDIDKLMSIPSEQRSEYIERIFDYDKYVSKMNENTPQLSKAEEEEIITELGASAEDFKESEEVGKIAGNLAVNYPDITAENFQKILIGLQINDTLGSEINKTTYNPYWIIKDTELPLKNEENSIYKIFERVPIYIVKNGIIGRELSNLKWYTTRNSVSLTSLTSSVLDDKYNNYNILYDTLVSIINDSNSQKLKVEMDKITNNIKGDADIINAKMRILNDYVETQKLQNEKAKSEIISYVTLVTIIIIGFCIMIFWTTIVSIFTKIFLGGGIASIFGGIANRWFGSDFGLNTIKDNMQTIVIAVLAMIPYVSDIYKNFMWILYKNVLIKIPILKNWITIKELDYQKYEDAAEKLSIVLQGNNPNEIKAAASKLLSDKPDAIIQDINKGGSRKHRRHTQKSRKTVKKYNKKGVKKLKTKHRLKTNKYNKTRKLKMKGGSNNNFITLEIINAIASVQYLFMFPEKFPIYSTSSVFNQIYQIISDIKIPVPETNHIQLLN